MKAILVVDMPDIPKNCMSCPLIDYHREYSIVCRHYQTGDTRPSWCPLRPMPIKKEVYYNDPFFGEVENLTNIGYNRCLIDLGETE